MRWSFLFCWVAVFFAGARLGLAETVALVRDGKPLAEVVISAEAEEEPLYPGMVSSVEGAAKELIATIREMSGAELPLRRVAPGEAAGEGLAIYLGKAALPLLGGKGAEGDESSFVLSVTPERVAIAGPTPRATEIGTHALLESLGVRWYIPGALGKVVPERRDVVLALGEKAESPSLRGRHFQLRGANAWIRHQRTGGPMFPSAHGIPLGYGREQPVPEEYLALVDGVRKGPQLCLSNPEVLRRATEEARAYFRKNKTSPWYGMGPSDGGGFCECEGCKALDSGEWDAFSNEATVTDRYISFFNAVLKGLEPEFTDRKIAFYIYHSYMMPPTKVKADPRIVGALAPIGLCRVHGVENPVCPEQGYLEELAGAWRKVLPELYERGYWFNLADPVMVFTQTHRLERDIPFYANQGLAGFRTETDGNWAAQGPSLYIAGRLMWDANASAAAVLAEFCEGMFGPAAGPMERYFTFMSERLRDADHHTGSAFNLGQFYPVEVRKEAAALLAEAGRKAPEAPFRERVELYTLGFERMEAFAQMMTARDRHDWAKAHEELGRVDTIMERLKTGYDVPMQGNAAESHLRRFFRHAVEQGAARTREGNELVAPLGAQWQMLGDPQGVGEVLGYYRADLTGGNWQAATPYQTPWSDIGLRYYKGLAWYRQEVEIPEKWAGKRLFLWFGGVDEQARIWVNGQEVGKGPGSAFTPFEVDATAAVRPGRNVVAVCVANFKTNELGTGGLVAPAMFYAPAKGAEAVLDNLRPLRETFP